MTKCKINEKCGWQCDYCTAAEAKEKAQKMKPRKTTIFEGKDAEKLAAKNLPNFVTYKCPVCNRSVSDRGFMGIRIKNYCENCGQAMDTDITQEQKTE